METRDITIEGTNITTEAFKEELIKELAIHLDNKTTIVNYKLTMEVTELKPVGMMLRDYMEEHSTIFAIGSDKKSTLLEGFIKLYNEHPETTTPVIKSQLWYNRNFNRFSAGCSCGWFMAPMNRSGNWTFKKVDKWMVNGDTDHEVLHNRLYQYLQYLWSRNSHLIPLSQFLGESIYIICNLLKAINYDHQSIYDVLMNPFWEDRGVEGLGDQEQNVLRVLPQINSLLWGEHEDYGFYVRHADNLPVDTKPIYIDVYN